MKYYQNFITNLNWYVVLLELCFIILHLAIKSSERDITLKTANRKATCACHGRFFTIPFKEVVYPRKDTVWCFLRCQERLHFGRFINFSFLLDVMLNKEWNCVKTDLSPYFDNIFITIYGQIKRKRLCDIERC